MKIGEQIESFEKNLQLGKIQLSNIQLIEDIKSDLRNRLNVNKVGKTYPNRVSQKARLIEMEFLQGMMVGYKHFGKEVPPAITICMMSGRSILTL